MHTIGLLFPPAEDVALLVVGGIGIMERQVRLLRRAGVTRFFAVDVAPLTPLPADVEAIKPSALASIIGRGDRVVAVASGLIIDERAIAAMLAAPVPAILTSGAGRPDRCGVERLDASSFAAGILALPGAMVLDVAAGLGEWDLASTLTRIAAQDSRTARIDFDALPVYAPARRRDVALIWSRPGNEAEARIATDIVISAAQKGCLDWPARFLHPWPEDLLVRLLAPTAITPNMVTLFTGVIGVGAGVAFACGWLWTGLVLALITGPLDGVDGKLARTRIEFSKWGDLEHLLDKVLEYGWYLCAAGHFAAVMHSGLPWALAALIILPALVEAVQGEFFRRATGKQLDDAGTIERRIRLVAGRRNTFLWTWLPLAALDMWFEGFIVLATYSVVTTAIAQWRFYVRFTAYANRYGDRIAANFISTGYAFLPQRHLSSN